MKDEDFTFAPYEEPDPRKSYNTAPFNFKALAIALLVMGIVLLAIGIYRVRTSDWSKLIKYDDIDETYEASQVTSLDITHYSGTMTITESKDGKIHFTGHVPQGMEKGKLENGLLTIASYDDNVPGMVVSYFFSEKYDISMELALPDKTFKEIVLQCSAGELNDEIPLKCEALKLDVTAGNVKLRQADADRVTAEISAGDVELSSFQSNDLTVKCSAGSLDYNGRADGNVDISVSAGKVSLELQNKAEEYSITGLTETGSPDADRTFKVSKSAGTVDVLFAK